MYKCKITPETTPKEEKEQGGKKKGGRKAKDGEWGVPRRRFQKPVKVFPSANTKLLGPKGRERRADTHSHTYATSNPSYYTKNTHKWLTGEL